MSTPNFNKKRPAQTAPAVFIRGFQCPDTSELLEPEREVTPSIRHGEPVPEG